MISNPTLSTEKSGQGRERGARTVDKEVARLKVAMEDVGGVDVLETAEGLVQERLEVGVG